ncbi:sugar phosphate nucleotidyltransferase [uncultured Alistipes sp.]|uniref:nucleotidyltransferase family protein n=1 Tax=uncultured Alistipes sp. TaxID=538949 RepID=UPI0026316196|nr:sugar phosphate nucleotidyltransferase [uncultured Alistipes sp.]
MVKPTLLVLAAGMGSRYGSLKQMDGVGPNGEAIIDYSIYDAVRAGFGRVVFVIRHLFEKEFREIFTPERFGGRIAVDFVFQELDKLPAGFTVPADRVKPWGTNHAVMMGAEAIGDEPFAVINADDFYGDDAYRTMADYLRSVAGQKNHYCMVGYEIRNTLSEHGAVSRGVCGVDRNGNLTSMVERTRIERREDGRIAYEDERGEWVPMADDTPVSMNMFGFTPDYFDYSEKYFSTYLKDNIDNPKSEFYIPTMVNKLVSDGKAQLRVLRSSARWFGVTYKEDRPAVVERIAKLVEAGVYPAKLWE